MTCPHVPWWWPLSLAQSAVIEEHRSLLPVLEDPQEDPDGPEETKNSMEFHALCAHGETVVFAGVDNKLRFLNAKDGKQFHFYELEHGFSLLDACVTPSGLVTFVLSRNAVLTSLSHGGQEATHRLAAPTDEPLALSCLCCRDTQVFCADACEPLIHVWDFKHGATELSLCYSHTLSVPCSLITYMSVCPDGKSVLLTSDNPSERAVFWVDLKTGKTLRRVFLGGGPLGAAVSVKGRVFVADMARSHLCVFDKSNASCLFSLPLPDTNNTLSVNSKTGELLAGCASQQRSAVVYRLK
jgi:WD40 repeat protein